MKVANAYNKLTFDNPLLRRYRYSLFRPSQLWVYLTVYAVVIALLLFINHSVARMAPPPINYPRLFDRVYYQLLTLAFLILCGWASLNSGTAISHEVASKTYDFFRLLPISAAKKTVGTLVGRNLIALLLGGITLVLAVIFGALGSISAFLQVQMVFLLVSGALLTNTAALLASSTNPKRPRKTSTLTWIVLILFLGPLVVQVFFLPYLAITQAKMAEHIRVGFYNLRIHVLILAALLGVYFSAWSTIGIIRKFTREGEPLFTRSGAILFVLGYELIALGLLIGRLYGNRYAAYVFWMISVFPVLLVWLGSLRGFDDYLERCRLTGVNKPSGRALARTLVAHSNLASAVILFGIWTVFAACVGHRAWVDAPRLTTALSAVLSFCLLAALLGELYVIYKPALPNIGVLVGFIVIVDFFLPLILSSAMRIPALQLYSIIGFFVHLFDSDAYRFVATERWVLVVNVLLSLAVAVPIASRYSRILALRKSM